ncbi:hypothetical protein BKI51_18775 [Alphaproteobacteria bacterium AO1-B]|nr:hypothetical protein BKI51_18775 [Alphaproteobacteria bacterium AO1-B]
MEFGKAIIVVIVLSLSIASSKAEDIPSRNFEILPGFPFSQLPDDIQKILNSGGSLTETEVVQLFLFMSALGREVNVGGLGRSDCSMFDPNCVPKQDPSKFDGTEKRFAFGLTSDQGFGLQQGVAYGVGGVSYGINRYDVDGIRGFADVIVATPEVTCQPWDLTCLQQGWRDRDPLAEPNYPNPVWCLGAEISHPETIKTLYKTIRGAAQELRQNHIRTYHDATYVTEDEDTKLKLDQLGVSEERQAQIADNAQAAPDPVSSSEIERIKERYDQAEEQRRSTGRVHVSGGYNKDQGGVYVGVTKHFQ